LGGWTHLLGTRMKHYNLIGPPTRKWQTNNWCDLQFQKWKLWLRSMKNNMHQNMTNFRNKTKNENCIFLLGFNVFQIRIQNDSNTSLLPRYLRWYPVYDFSFLAPTGKLNCILALETSPQMRFWNFASLPFQERSKSAFWGLNPKSSFLGLYPNNWELPNDASFSLLFFKEILVWKKFNSSYYKINTLRGGYTHKYIRIWNIVHLIL